MSLSALAAKYHYFLYLPESRLRSAVSPLLFAKSGAAAAPEILFALTIFSGLALIALQVRSRLWRWSVTGLSLILASVMICANVAGAETVRIYGMDPKIGMVVYSDFFFSENGRVMVASLVPHGLAIAVLVAIACAAAAAIALRNSPVFRKAFLTALIPGALILMGVAAANRAVDAPYKHSPSFSFFASLRTLDAEALTGGDGPSAPLPLGPLESPALPPGGIEGVSNVVVVVIESAAAEYFGAYGSRYGATPQFDRLAARGVLMEAAYAHMPGSNPAMTSLLTARYPPFSLQEWIPTTPMLPAALEAAGMRTGFFHSSDIRYGRADELLAASGFGTVRDFRTRPCDLPLLEDLGDLMTQGTPDRCTFEELQTWIAGGDGRPFFAMLWTFQTHFPYFATAPVSHLSDPRAPTDEFNRENLRRYLAALRETDRLIGSLHRFLESEGLAQSTLLVVTADHGEAFGQHGTFAHGGTLADENVRVPLLFVHPSLAPKRSDRVTGQVDFAPTMTELLGATADPGWRGASLFAPRRATQTPFFNPWADVLLGYRLGSRKVMGKMLTGEVEVYDTLADPGERRDLAAGDEELQRIEMARLRTLARWLDRPGQGSPRVEASHR